MQENSFEVPELSISDVIKEAVRLYKDNYNLFLKTSFLIFIINFTNSILGILQYLIKDTSALIFYNLFLFITIFPFIYFEMKFSIVMYVCVWERYSERDIDIKSALNIASEKTWRYIGVSILLALILIVPVAGMVIPFLFIKDLLVKLLVMGLFAIPATYFGTIFIFVPNIVIFEQDEKRRFSVSKKLVRGDFWGVFLLTAVVMLVFSAPYFMFVYALNDYNAIPEGTKYIISSIHQFVQMFVTPFTYSLSVVLYYKLKRNKGIG